MRDESFSHFIEKVLDSFNFNWLVTLGYNPVSSPKVSAWRRHWEDMWAYVDPQGHEGWSRNPATARDCFNQWSEEIREGPGVRNYLCLEERRSGGKTLFHALIADWNGFEDAWEQRWKEISGGWARTRELDGRIGGLLGHLVMRSGCTLELNCGKFRGRYTAADFKPWNAKRY